MTPELRRFAIALAGIGLGGCAAQRQQQANDAALLLLQARLPGHYDNAAQVHTETALGATEKHAALDLLIAPANAALVGKTVYYVRETAAGDPRRVLSQYIWVFGRTIEARSGAGHGGGSHGGSGQGASSQAAGGQTGSSQGGSGSQSAGSGQSSSSQSGSAKTPEQHLEQHIYLFKEPQRWTHVAEQRELLESLLPEDLERLTGCEMLWTQKDTGFVAERRSSASCAPATPAEGQLLELRIELHDNQLALLEQQVGPDGLVDVAAGLPDPYYRFLRRGAAN
jgi:CpeT/CpcT family (DUF1001)